MEDTFQFFRLASSHVHSMSYASIRNVCRAGNMATMEGMVVSDVWDKSTYVR
ncbi:hypothetical protein DPMN_050641 [Dreissena polymorpha]|uniref:Uncharacterized protein n=1 Tax=Dreissena polymorpha TaxID=45954 RepID=A0A9D4CHL8_DREPO|nr:hypothetical protein DPMN_050641 [Dreissena polymorpha]